QMHGAGYRAGRPAHRDQDGKTAAVDMVELRACRQRAGIDQRAEAARGRALLIFRPERAVNAKPRDWAAADLVEQSARSQSIPRADAGGPPAANCARHHENERSLLEPAAD